MPEIIEAAASFKLKAVGISDHFATTKVNSVMPDFLSRYIDKIREAAFPYAGVVKVFAGAELDSSPKRTYYDQIRYDDLRQLDYLLVEYISDEDRAGMPLYDFLEVRKKIQCPVGFAHNDLARTLGHVEAKDLAELLAAEKIFIELNTNKDYSRLGRQFYRLWPELFKALADAGVPISYGADVHSRIADVGNIGDAAEFARTMGLEANAQAWLDTIESYAKARKDNIG